MSCSAGDKTRLTCKAAVNDQRVQLALHRFSKLLSGIGTGLCMTLHVVGMRAV